MRLVLVHEAGVNEVHCKQCEEEHLAAQVLQLTPASVLALAEVSSVHVLVSAHELSVANFNDLLDSLVLINDIQLRRLELTVLATAVDFS